MLIPPLHNLLRIPPRYKHLLHFTPLPLWIPRLPQPDRTYERAAVEMPRILEAVVDLETGFMTSVGVFVSGGVVSFLPAVPIRSVPVVSAVEGAEFVEVDEVGVEEGALCEEK